VANFERFVMANLHVLEAMPWLTFQQAANQPKETAPARTADSLWGTGGERRPWIRWINKPTTHATMTLLGHTGEITACMYSPDGAKILSASRDGTLKIWDADTGQIIHTLNNEKQVMSCTYSRDGSQIASITWDEIRIWDPSIGRPIRSFPATKGLIACDFAPDGTRLVTATNTAIAIWDMTTGRQVQSFARNNLPGDKDVPQRGDFDDCAFSPDSRLVIAIGHDRALRVWDLVTGEAMLIPPIEPYLGAFDLSCSFSSDGLMIVSSGDRGPTIRSTATKQVIRQINGGTWGGPCKMSADSRWIVSRTFRDEVGVWSATSGELAAVYAGHTAEIIDVAFSPDGTRVLSGAEDCTIKVWSFAAVDEKIPRQSIEEVRARGHTSEITSCAFSPDGECFATGAGDHTVRIWDSSTGLQIGRALRHPGGALINRISVAFSPVGRQLFSKSIRAPGLACVWDVDSGQGLATFSRKNQMSIVDTPVDEGQVRELATGAFLDAKRNAIFIGGTGTGKTHLCIAVASAVIRTRARGRFFNLVDLVNQLEQEKAAGRSGRLAEKLLRHDLIVIDELGYLPFSQSGGQLLFHLISKLYENTSLLITTNLAFSDWPQVFGDAKMFPGLFCARHGGGLGDVLPGRAVSASCGSRAFPPGGLR
jgi:WD40 repeat protein